MDLQHGKKNNMKLGVSHIVFDGIEYSIDTIKNTQINQNNIILSNNIFNVLYEDLIL